MTWTLIFLLEVHKLAKIEYQRLEESRSRPAVIQQDTARTMEKSTLEKPTPQVNLGEGQATTHSMNTLEEFQ